eukprot:5967121-Prymnesium_polylepis.2
MRPRPSTCLGSRGYWLRAQSGVTAYRARGLSPDRSRSACPQNDDHVILAHRHERVPVHQPMGTQDLRACLAAIGDALADLRSANPPRMAPCRALHTTRRPQRALVIVGLSGARTCGVLSIRQTAYGPTKRRPTSLSSQ